MKRIRGIFLAKLISPVLCLAPVVTWGQPVAEQYRPMELKVDAGRLAPEDAAMIGAANPFDKAQVRLQVLFFSPAGDTVNADGFYYEGFVPVQDTMRHHKFWTYLPHEYLEADSSRGWAVRLSPEQAGTWRYTAEFVLPASGRSIAAAEGGFECRAGDPRNGIVRLSNRQYFTYPGGEAYRPLGINAAVYPEWCDEQPKLAFYDLYFRRLSENGGNFARIWVDFNASLYLFRPTGQPGRFSMPDAYYLDQIVGCAERYGIKLQVCIFASNNFEDPPNNPDPTIWDVKNSFSEYLGGPCSEPRDFLDTANMGAMALQQNFIAYIIDRWGSSPAVLSWELFNEADGASGDSALLVSWHSAMYRFIKSYDGYGRAVTTSFMGGADGCRGMYEAVFAKMDYASLHRYTDQWLYPRQNSKDIWYNCTASYCRELPQLPACIGEAGSLGNSQHGYEVLDSMALNYHSELWASLFFGGIMPVSYWEWYIYVQRTVAGMPASNYMKQLPAVRVFMERMPPLGCDGMSAMCVLPKKKSQLRAYYLQDADERTVWGWVQDEYLQINNLIDPATHTTSAYLGRLDQALRPSRSGAKNKLVLSRLPASGRYTVCWYSTATGLPVSETSCRALFQRTVLAVPDSLLYGQYGDAAFTLKYVDEE